MLGKRAWLVFSLSLVLFAAPMAVNALDIGSTLKTVQSAGDFSKKLEGYYNQLMGFQSGGSFQDADFTSSSEYGDWKGDVTDLGEEAETSAQKKATGNLLQLGDAYQDSKGAETDLTKTLTSALKSFF